MTGEKLWVAFAIEGDLPRLLGVFPTEEDALAAGDGDGYMIVDSWTMTA